jgi:hypothetical protein
MYDPMSAFIDVGLVSLVLTIVQQAKKCVRNRWVPLLPWGVSFVLCSLATLRNGWFGWGAFFAGTFIDTMKVAFASMGLFKIWHTTIKGE